MELAVIAVIALLIFGRRLPEIMRGLGGSVREFRKGIEEGGLEDKPDDSKKIAGTQEREEQTKAADEAPPARDEERRL